MNDSKSACSVIRVALVRQTSQINGLKKVKGNLPQKNTKNIKPEDPLLYRVFIVQDANKTITLSHPKRSESKLLVALDNIFENTPMISTIFPFLRLLKPFHIKIE